MERNSLSNNLKHQSFGPEKIMKDTNKLKDIWNCGSENNDGDDFLAGFSWPPRSYTCSFCKREFRSAQALGGHMNVHRRDRAARLRLSPPPPRESQCSLLNLNINPKPNPSFSSSPHFAPSTRLPALYMTSTLPPLVSPSISSLSSPCSALQTEKNMKCGDHLSCKESDFLKKKTTKNLFGVRELDAFKNEREFMPVKTAEFVKLDLGIGPRSDAKQDLDLELRLGYS